MPYDYDDASRNPPGSGQTPCVFCAQDWLEFRVTIFRKACQHILGENSQFLVANRRETANRSLDPIHRSSVMRGKASEAIMVALSPPFFMVNSD